jgi:hypothetical protein
MAKFEVEFRDGHKEVVDKNTADDAKAASRNARRQELPRDTPKSADELMVKRVTKLE